MIDKFVAQLGKRSIARATHYEFEVLSIPALLRSTDGVADFQRDLRFLCVGVDMPGTQLLTQEHRIYDMPEKFAYQKAHDEIQLTIRVDKDYLSRSFFESWADSVYNSNTGNVYYKETYIGEVRLSTMREDGTCPYCIIFSECFPTQIGNISYSWESTGQVATFTVAMAFTRKRVEAREALFEMPQRESTGGDPNQQTSNSNMGGFDIEFGRSGLGLKDNNYSAINNAFDDKMTQRLTMASTQIDPAIFKQITRF